MLWHFHPRIAACLKWARFEGRDPRTAPPMTRMEALANAYEEAIDAINYLGLAEEGALARQAEEFATTIRKKILECE